MPELSGRFAAGRVVVSAGAHPLAPDDPVALMAASLVAGALREASAYLRLEGLPADGLRVVAEYRVSDLDPNRLGGLDLTVATAEELRYEQRAGLAHRVNNYAARVFGKPPLVCVCIAAAAPPAVPA